MSNETLYTKTFDQYNRHWSHIPDYNKLFLMAQQNYMNDLLKTRGHVFLNEAHDILGLDRTSEGQLAGWSIEKNPDSYVNFNIVDNEDGTYGLTFNVDGTIYDLLPN